VDVTVKEKQEPFAAVLSCADSRGPVQYKYGVAYRLVMSQIERRDAAKVQVGKGQ
jgi:hypothetical protein